MKIKKFSLVNIFLAITVVAYIAASLLFCYTTKPKITEGEFPFSITYEYNGETKTLSGVYECEYISSHTIHGEHSRYWSGEARYENAESAEEPYVVEKNEDRQTTLAVFENMDAGYFMGDPLHQDYYQIYGHDGAEPYIEYFDYKNDISLEDGNRDEILASIGFKILDFTYAEPIENDFSFSGISYEADNIFIFIAILLVFFLLCLIFVRRDPEYRYNELDKCGIILNFLVGIVAVPFISVICMLFGLVGSGVELIDQIIYNIPPIAILCLALSVVFRRKGYSKLGFFIQFGGVLLFVLSLVL